MTYEILVLGASDVREAFDWDIAIESQRRAFAALGNGEALLAEKVALCYAARASRDTGPVSKFISVHSANPSRGLPMVHALVTVLDPVDGRPVALIEGNEVTTRRTAAASALAISLLANAQTSILAVLGSGVQGQEHIRALTRVRRFERVHLWSPTSTRCREAAAKLSDELGIEIIAKESAKDAVTGAHVAATCTSSAEPVLLGSWLSPGCTVLSVGSFTEARCEIDAEAIRRAARVVVDHVPTEVKHGGPIVQAIRRGELRESDLVPLADIVLGRHPGRTSEEDILVYNSVGIGVQDAAAAWTIIERARATGRGQRIAL